MGGGGPSMQEPTLTRRTENESVTCWTSYVIKDYLIKPNRDIALLRSRLKSSWRNRRLLPDFYFSGLGGQVCLAFGEEILRRLSSAPVSLLLGGRTLPENKQASATLCNERAQKSLLFPLMGFTAPTPWLC